MSASLTDYVNYLQPSFVEWKVPLEAKEAGVRLICKRIESEQIG